MLDEKHALTRVLSLCLCSVDQGRALRADV